MYRGGVWATIAGRVTITMISTIAIICVMYYLFVTYVFGKRASLIEAFF